MMPEERLYQKPRRIAREPQIDPALAILTVIEVAKVLRCHPDKVYGLVRTGAIRGTRLGKASIRITREELERFIRYGSATAGKTPNTWTIRWYERDAHGVNKQQRVAFRGTKAEALAEHGRLIGRSVRGLSPMARARTPFSVFCDEWLKHRRQRVMVESEEDEDISPTHWRTQESYIRLQIKPVLGAYKIGEIGPRQIDEAKTAWRSMKQKRKYVDKPLSRRTVHHIFTTLRKILNDAVLWKYIDSNPCAGVTIPKKGNRSLGSISLAAARTIIDHESLEPVHVAAVMGMFTGLRRGELLALSWEDIDFEQGVVFVMHATTQLLDADRTLALKDVKTGESGRRAVPLAPMLQSLLLGGRRGMTTTRSKPPVPPNTSLLFGHNATALLPHRASYRRNIRLRIGRWPYPDSLLAYRCAHPQAVNRVFFGGSGIRRYDEIWNAKTFSSALRRHLKTLCIEDVTIQRLRHAFNSLGNLAGSNEATRSGMMGHTSTRMTRTQYTTLYKEQASEAVQILESFLRQTRPKTSPRGLTFPQ